jgi:hypothetical protein
VGEESTSGKLKIDKYGEGFSPNRADAAAMATAPRNRPMNISSKAVADLQDRLAHEPQVSSYDSDHALMNSIGMIPPGTVWR